MNCKRKNGQLATISILKQTGHPPLASSYVQGNMITTSQVFFCGQMKENAIKDEI
jgi:hypothetical protein